MLNNLLRVRIIQLKAETSFAIKSLVTLYLSLSEKHPDDKMFYDNKFLSFSLYRVKVLALIERPQFGSDPSPLLPSLALKVP